MGCGGGGRGIRRSGRGGCGPHWTFPPRPGSIFGPLHDRITRAPADPRPDRAPGAPAHRTRHPTTIGPPGARSPLKLEVDTSAPTVAKISLSVPADEFQKEVAAGLRNASGQVRMKGFRPGKVPAKFLEKQFGEGIRREVKEHFLQRAYGQAVQEHSLKPIAHPRLAPEKLELSDDGSFAVEFEVPLKPAFELPDYKGLDVASELEPVMDEQIDATLDELRKSQATPQPAGEDGLTEDGFVVADLVFLHGDDVVFEREGMRLNTVSVPPGVDPEAFAEGMKGVRADEERSFPMELPEFIEREDVRGQQGTARLTVKECLDLVPPTDDELVAMIGGDEVSDMEALRAFVKERLEENAQERENQRIETALLDRVLEAVEVELPEVMVEQQAEARLSQLAHEMQQRGAPEEEVEKAREAEREGARKDASKGLKALLVVERIGEVEELLVSNDDLDQELRAIAARNNTSLDEVRKYYGENNLGQQLAIEILEKKVRRFLRENADIQVPS